MRILCVSPFATNEAELQSFSVRLETEFRRAGHDFTVAAPADFQIIHGAGFPLAHPTIDLASIDLFHHALLPNADALGWEIVGCLRAWGRPIARPPQFPGDDKVTMARLFTRADIPIPATIIASDLPTARAGATRLGYPLVGKLPAGSKGEGVRLITDDAALQDFVASCQPIAPLFVLQELVEPMGRDIRAFVVGDRVVAAMERLAAPGDFRANYALSGQARPVTLTHDEAALAVRVAAVYYAPYAGVDLMRGGNGTVVLEINKAPAIRGIEAVTGINVAAAIVAHLEMVIAHEKAGARPA